MVHKLIVGAAAGGLVTVAGLALVFHPAGSQRLVIASVVQIIAMAAIALIIERPRPKRSLTWPAAMLGAVVVAGLSLVAFGQVPHEWISYADSELNWGRRDLIMFELPGLPFDISRMAIRDMIAAGMYTNSFAGALALWLMWQRRHEMADERARAREEAAEPPSSVPAGTSAYGRPLSKQA